MKTLFRSIRMTFLNENKTAKYLKYAIGEIVLIIVGIFFALQLNNWNEDRKAQVEFYEYIVQLKEDVRTAIFVAEGRIASAESRAEQAYTILGFLKRDGDESFELAKIESSFNGLGRFIAPDVRHGYLRDLRDGNFDAIARDKELAKKVLLMNERIEESLAIVLENGEFFKLAQATITRFLGRENLLYSDVKISYDLDAMRNSNEFQFAIQNLLQFLADAHSRYSDIKDELGSFLSYLEERY